MMVSTQKRNPEMVDILRADFQARYEPNFAWVNAMSAFQMLPGLRGFWPMSGYSSLAAIANALDYGGAQRHLTNNGPAVLTYSNLIPVLYFDGTNDYLSRADEAGLDILGNEAYIATTVQGLTMGGWFRFSTLPVGAIKGVIGKWDTGGNDRSYLIYINNGTSSPTFDISNGGAATSATVTSSVTMSQDGWYFIVARFDPSTEINIIVNNTETTNAVGIPATLFNGAASFEIFSYNLGLAASRNHGYASLCFLTTTLLTDFHVNALFQQTRALFGV